MDKEYYIPKLEDIMIGYECKINAPKYCDGKTFIIDEDQMQYAALAIRAGFLFTKFLTKEQIVGEGWKALRKIEGGYYTTSRFSDNNYWYFSMGDLSIKSGNWDKFHMRYKVDDRMIHITSSLRIESKLFRIPTFYGFCPSINELRYISKLLGIHATKNTSEERQQ